MVFSCITSSSLVGGGQPSTVFDASGAQTLALAGVFVGPNMNILVQRPDDRLPGKNQRRYFGASADYLAPAFKDRRHGAGLILFFRQRRERRQLTISFPA